jgi:hypothetical protein
MLAASKYASSLLSNTPDSFFDEAAILSDNLIGGLNDSIVRPEIAK